MARIVRHEATAPIKIDPNLLPGQTPPAPNVIAWPRDAQGNLKVVQVCACGISATYPFCDGAHKTCKEEQAGMVYAYDIPTRTVREVRGEGA
jgi:CDGSH-type Zn-finger protein